MDTFAEIYGKYLHIYSIKKLTFFINENFTAGFYKPLENQNVEKLVRILSNRTDENNVSECLDRLRFNGWNLDCNEVYPNLFISDA